MHNITQTAYRLAVVTLLGALVWMVHREGERIVAGLWSPSEPLQVEVSNSTHDAVPVQIQQQETTDDPIQPIRQAADKARMQQQTQAWLHNSVSARAAANHLTPEEQRRFDALYGPQPAPAATAVHY